ncbi:hypothetical protein DAI22_04g070750 [Oryza sativa Japonica Group]|nr:hypothetical protein DAI22_04g070750 [Oryza sativa Japonica Group]
MVSLHQNHAILLSAVRQQRAATAQHARPCARARAPTPLPAGNQRHSPIRRRAPPPRARKEIRKTELLTCCGADCRLVIDEESARRPAGRTRQAASNLPPHVSRMCCARVRQF